jgi:hypothetical protein
MAESPCKNCYVTGIQYTSKYDNGSEIITMDGIWMHHCVMSSLTRAQSYTPLGPNILWAGGNERPTLRLNTRYKYGLDWPLNFNFLIEYMSSIQQDTNVSLAITFEYLEKNQPGAEQYRDSYLIWNSVGTPAYKNGTYDTGSSAYVVPKSGVLLHGMGHMHDGMWLSLCSANSASSNKSKQEELESIYTSMTSLRVLRACTITAAQATAPV